MSVARAARTLFLAGLGVVAFLALRGVDEGGTLTLGPGDDGLLESALVSDRPPARIEWTDAAGPDGRAAWLLSPGPAVPPLVMPVGSPERLRVVPPARPIAGRASALDVTLDAASEGAGQARAGEPPADGGAATDGVATAAPGSWIAWHDALGAGDSLRATAGTDGRARVGLRVLPARPGWHSWTVRAGDDSVVVGAWVRPERSVRVLALVDQPDWEARFALRALDEAGVDVDARFDLGRIDIGAAEWDVGAYDVVMIFGARIEEPAATERLLDLVRQGGGVIVAPPPGAPPAGAEGGAGRPTSAADGGGLHRLLRAFGLAASVAAGAPLEAGASIEWSLPADLVPLPPAPVRVATVALADPGLAAGRAADGGGGASGRVVVVARAPDGPPLVAARSFGRGRAAVLGLAESWRWRMEGGMTEAHRAWWLAWIDWAASGLRDAAVVRLPLGPVAAGAVVPVTVETLDPAATPPASLRLERPDGSVEELRPVRVDRGRSEARFLAARPGAYRVTWPVGAATAGRVPMDVEEDAPGAGGAARADETGVLALEAPTAPDPSSRALLAIGSGRRGASSGIPLPPGRRPAGAADDPRAAASPPTEDRPWRGGERTAFPPILGALLAAAVLVEWSVRRLGGGP